MKHCDETLHAGSSTNTTSSRYDNRSRIRGWQRQRETEIIKEVVINREELNKNQGQDPGFDQDHVIGWNTKKKDIRDRCFMTS